MSNTATNAATSPMRLALSWVLVGVPLAYGVYMTLLEAVALFTA
jgi:hypothetical protein